MNYDRVKSLFHRLDPSRSGSLSSNDLRTIIEDLLQYTLKADEFYQLLRDTPLDQHGRVLYKEYLKRLLDRALKTQEQHPSNRSLQWSEGEVLIRFSPLRFTQWDLVQPPLNKKEKFPSERLKRVREQVAEEQSFVNQATTNNEQQQQQQGRNIEQVREERLTLG